MYFLVESPLWLCLTIVVGAVFSLLARFKWGRTLLLRFPGIFSMGVFSSQGPTPEQLAAASFTTTVTAFCRAAPPPLDSSSSSSSSSKKKGGGVGGGGGGLLTGPLPSSFAYAPDAPVTKGAVTVTIRGPEPGYVATP